MRPLKPLPKGAARELTRLLQQAATKADYRRVLCVWLRAAVGLSAAEIALALGWRTSSVYSLQSRYRREGAQALQGAGQGGAHHAWLSPEQEQQFLHSFVSTACQGGIPEVSIIRRAYEQEVGHEVAPSTVYRLLTRHGWRKLVPRPTHPDTSREAQEAFKKSSAVWCAPNPNAKHNAAWRYVSCLRMRHALDAWWSRDGLGRHRVCALWWPPGSSASTAMPMPPSVHMTAR
jgi:transposase